MRKQMDEMLTLLRARDPLIYVDTYEENEFIVDMCNILSKNSIDGGKYKLPTRIYTYTRTSGMRLLDINAPLDYEKCKVVDNVGNINDAINFVRECQYGLNGENRNKDIFAALNRNNETNNDNKENNIANERKSAIFIFKDLHLFFQDKDVIRFIRDIKEQYISKGQYCPIIVTSPVVDIPVELEKLFTYFEYHLMDKSEIHKKIMGIVPNAITYSDGEVNNIQNACIGLTSREMDRALIHSIVKNNSHVKHQDIYDEKIQLVKKSGCIDYVEPQYNIDDLGGCGKFKEWILKIKEAMDPKAREFGIPFPKGAMLVGVPGTSKTASAEIMASYLKIPLLKIDMSKIMGSFVGQSEKGIANALRIAQAVSPCIVLLDECEKQIGGYSSSNQSDSGTLSRVTGTILDFLQKDTNVITIMTSNDVSQLPPELTRSGRIDAQWMFDLPNKYERHDIIDIYIKKNGLIISDDLHEYLDKRTENFTGAEIKSAIKDMLVNCYYRQKNNSQSMNKVLIRPDIDNAIDNTVTVYKSSKEKIYNFRNNAAGRYLNASYSEKELAEKVELPKSPFQAVNNKSNIFTLA